METENIKTNLYSPRRKHKKKHKKTPFDIPGVRKICLSELTQKIIECTVGHDVTAENPWKYVRKELVQDNVELHEGSSDFLPVRMEIMQYTGKDILIGYIADEGKEGQDEFYICVTEEAAETVSTIIERIRQAQQARLYNQVYKSIHPWTSLGTEKEIETEEIKYSRPLIEVEVESRYPISQEKVTFRLVPAEKRRQGYVELKCDDEILENVYMRRIDNATQVTPDYVENEAQTNCAYPKNAATQYLYKVPSMKFFIPPLPAGYYQNLADLLNVNSTINLYTNDYQSLVLDSTTEEVQTSSKDYEEFMFFTDVNLCKNKMISDIHWHPMWTGTIAIAYCDLAPFVFRYGLSKEDYVFTAVHGINIVLIWSFKDALKPKLILEAPREICSISFCKFDDNILIGGCQNGQIVIWDIRNKLQKVEEKENLTVAKQKYRTYMNSLMKWMKNIHDISVVRVAAASDLKYSHKGRVTTISWMDPFFEVTKVGKITEIDVSKPDATSMQVITSSLDGTVLIWDLKMIPVYDVGSYKPKKLKRLKKRPSELQVDVSPYKALHLNLRPVYKINIWKTGDGNKLSAITQSTTLFCRPKYKEIESDKSKRTFQITDRILFKPIMEKMKTLNDVLPRMKIGTAAGSFMEISWEGHDFDPGEIINSEEAVKIFTGRYHDGPINGLTNSLELNVTLTVGGKIWALWRKDMPNRPILWRRNRQNYVKGEFDKFQPYKVVLLTATGLVQKWFICVDSKKPFYEQNLSNNFLTVSAAHPFMLKKNVYGFGNEQGAFRTYFAPASNIRTDGQMTDETRLFLEREVKRKLLFYEWQDECNKRKQQNVYLTEGIKEKEEKAVEIAEETEEVTKTKPQHLTFVERIIAQRNAQEQERIKAIIIAKKQLDTKELERRRQPLQKLEEENERKKEKQRKRLQEGDQIFHETVASLFPDAIKQKPPPPVDPYAGGYSIEDKGACYTEYSNELNEFEKFISSHPYQYDFSYKNLIVDNRNKKIQDEHLHKTRYETERKSVDSTEIEVDKKQEDDESIRDGDDEHQEEESELTIEE